MVGDQRHGIGWLVGNHPSCKSKKCHEGQVTSSFMERKWIVCWKDFGAECIENCKNLANRRLLRAWKLVRFSRAFCCGIPHHKGWNFHG